MCAPTHNFQGAGEPPLYVLPQISGGPLTLPAPGTGSINAATDFGYKDPRSYQWSFTIERELARDTMARVSYIGSQTVGLGLEVDLNQQPASTIKFDANRRPYLAWNSVGYLTNLGFASLQRLAGRVDAPVQ